MGWSQCAGVPGVRPGRAALEGGLVPAAGGALRGVQAPEPKGPLLLAPLQQSAKSKVNQSGMLEQHARIEVIPHRRARQRLAV